MDLTSFFSKLGVPANFAQDIFLLAVVVGASFLLGMFVGRFRLIAILANTYIALAVSLAVPKEYLSNYLYQVGFFFFVIVFMTIFGKRIFDTYLSGWRVFVLSFLEVGLILSILVSMLPRKIVLKYISLSAYGYLIDPLPHLIWVIAPLIFLLMIQKRLNR